MRPYTLRIQIFDWGGRLYRTRTGSERWANKKAIKLGAKGCLLFIFPLQVLSYLNQLTLWKVVASTDLSQCAEPLP
ncbi:hypothetical protein [Nostoc sp.]|uniref:hypothetical protein n=1 Tax=Nostoc sp. TaxID=1180 RepID=UPI002FF952C3